MTAQLCDKLYNITPIFPKHFEFKFVLNQTFYNTLAVAGNIDSILFWHFGPQKSIKYNSVWKIIEDWKKTNNSFPIFEPPEQHYSRLENSFLNETHNKIWICIVNDFSSFWRSCGTFRRLIKSPFFKQYGLRQEQKLVWGVFALVLALVRL